MFAVILSGGKQYLVRQGDKLKIEKVETAVGETHTFEKVLLASQDGSSVDIGQPFLSQKVKGKVLEQGKHDKIRVFKMKAKKNYRRTYGHRQPFTTVEITSLS